MTMITRLVGVYDADGTLRAEAAYWIGARLGRRHCALCDITHSAWRERPDWKACRGDLPVPFATVHRDEIPPGVASLDARPPYVAAETSADEPIVLLDGDRVEACAGDPGLLMAAIEQAADDLELGWSRGTESSPSRR